MVLVKHFCHSRPVNRFRVSVHVIELSFCSIAWFLSEFFSEVILDGENVALVIVLGRLAAGQTEVAESDTTVTVYEEIARFEVSVQ